MTTRRDILKKAAISASGVAIMSSANAQAIMKSCSLTPAQTEGPFYPINDQVDKDADLTFVKDRNKKALGEVIILKGTVLDDECRPVENALVEIWQACASGKYNHPGDPNPAPLDENFQYWGRALTNEKGEYEFKTIRPGHYAATSDWTRPAHIHFKVHRRGYEELTSQIYFKDDPYNSKDRILMNLTADERKEVIVDFKKVRGVLSPKHPKVGNFNITIRSL